MKKRITLIIGLSLLLSSFIIGQSQVTYDVKFTSIWNADDHTNIPGNAHWSKLVGATHKTPNTFFELKKLATTGIKNVAETGNNTVFKQEVDAQVNQGEADQYINGPNLGTATGNILISNLEVKKEFPLLTLVSMIAPSPDWIIGINGYSLLDQNGKWKKTVTLDMFAYDTGTDSGTDYTSGNKVTNPFEPISMINGSPINGKKMGTLTITLKTVLNIKNSSPFKNVNIYPNPASQGKITIENLIGLELNKVEIFNVSGSMVKSINRNLETNTLVVNTQDLPSGIYLLKLSSSSDLFTKKFVID